MWKIYKEGQGKWARGLLMFVVGLGALYIVRALHDMLPSNVGDGEPWRILGWAFDYRWLIEGPILLAAVAFGVWLFNHRSTVDFLIDTESELKNKVTWPSREEEVNASIVVCVTVVLMMVFITVWDAFFTAARDNVLYPFGS